MTKSTVDVVERKPEAGGLLLSALVHALVAAILIILGSRVPQSETPAISVDLVAEPNPPPAPPKPSEEEKPRPPPPPPPPPQLQTGRLDPASHGGKPAATGHPSAPVGRAVPSSPDGAAIALGAGKRTAEGSLTQTERDMILAQILPFWRPPPELMGTDAVIQVRVMVKPDGSLAPPFTATDPWNPSRAIVDYDSLPPRSLLRQTLEGFYLALRMAQPLRLVPELKSKAPLAVTLDFKVRDVQ